MVVPCGCSHRVRFVCGNIGSVAGDGQDTNPADSGRWPLTSRVTLQLQRAVTSFQFSWESVKTASSRWDELGEVGGVLRTHRAIGRGLGVSEV